MTEGGDWGRDTPQGVELALRVTPRAGKNAVTGERGGKLLLSVRAVPTDGEANAAVVQTLAELLGVAKGRVHLVRGEKSREKWVRVADVSLDEVRDTLERRGIEPASRLEKSATSSRRN